MKNNLVFSFLLFFTFFSLASCSVYEQLKTKPRDRIEFLSTSVVAKSKNKAGYNDILIYVDTSKLSVRKEIENSISKKLSKLNIRSTETLSLELGSLNLKKLQEVARENNLSNILIVGISARVEEVGTKTSGYVISNMLYSKTYSEKELAVNVNASIFSTINNEIVWQLESRADIKGYMLKYLNSEIVREVLEQIKLNNLLK